MSKLIAASVAVLFLAASAALAAPMSLANSDAGAVCYKTTWDKGHKKILKSETFSPATVKGCVSKDPKTEIRPIATCSNHAYKWVSAQEKAVKKLSERDAKAWHTVANYGCGVSVNTTVDVSPLMLGR